MIACIRADCTVRPDRDAAAVADPPLRVVDFRPRTIFRVIGILIATAIVLEVIWIARHVLSWVFIALFLALALNPAVDWLERRINRRGAAAAIVFFAALVAIVGIAYLFVPTLINQVNDFAGKVPDYLHDLTKGRGRLGFLQEKYHLVDKARKALREGGASKLFGVSGAALAVAKGVVNAVLATVTIAFLTFFMLLEGPAWIDSFLRQLPDEPRRRWRKVGHEIYRTVGGYVTGNLLISVICGLVYGIALAVLGVPFPVALGFIVAILDLIPLAGATIGGVIVVVAGLITSTQAGIGMAIVVIVYQQAENQVLQPII